MHRLNVTLIDLVYIASGLIGLAVSLHALPNYHRSVRAARLVRNPADRRDAVHINVGIVSREYLRLSIHVLGVVVGVAALWIVPVHRPVVSPYDRDFGIVLDAILLWANIGTTANTVLAWMEYCVIRRRGWFERDGLLDDLRGRIGRAEGGDKRGVSRATVARILRDLRILRRSIKGGGAKDGIIEVVVEKTISKTTTKRIDGSEDGSASHADRPQ